MAIWREIPTIEQLNMTGRQTIAEALGVEFTSVGEDHLVARMPVDWRTKQPAGLLHGGASVVLAETLGSVASALCAPSPEHRCVGIEVNANHLKSATSGYVTGVVRPLHVGKTTHVWDIRISNDEGAMVCVSRLTVAVIAPKAGS